MTLSTYRQSLRNKNNKILIKKYKVKCNISFKLIILNTEVILKYFMFRKKSSLAKRFGEKERKEDYEQQCKERGHVGRKYSMLCTSHRWFKNPVKCVFEVQWPAEHEILLYCKGPTVWWWGEFMINHANEYKYSTR